MKSRVYFCCYFATFLVLVVELVHLYSRRKEDAIFCVSRRATQIQHQKGSTPIFVFIFCCSIIMLVCCYLFFFAVVKLDFDSTIFLGLSVTKILFFLSAYFVRLFKQLGLSLCIEIFVLVSNISINN